MSILQYKSDYTFTFKDGDKIGLHYVGLVAELLGRTKNCLRKWELSGVFPKTIFRDEYMRRLYSREQIIAILQSAEDAELNETQYSISKFSKLCHQRLSVLEEIYKKKGF